MDTLELIAQQIKTHPIVLYMKGTPQFPQCGFSARAVALLSDAIQSLNATYAGNEFFSVNVLEEPDIRRELPSYANWPTFPQLYIQGELVGGSDVMAELHAQGELQKLVKSALLPQTV